jgi:alpha-N-arabinofuranosidase
MAHQAERAIRICASTIERVCYEQRIKHPVGIAYDEWNVWYRTRDEAGRRSGLEEQYDLSDALAVATFLNIFVRQCRAVEIANLAQMVNVIAPIFTRPDGLFLQTIYHPLRLYAEHTLPTALDVFVDAPLDAVTSDAPPSGWDRTWDTSDLGPFSLLDASATCSADEVSLAVVNRSRDQAITTTIDGVQFAGECRVFTVDGPSVDARNSFEAPDGVNVREGTWSGREYTFPPHSVTVIRGQLGSARLP